MPDGASAITDALSVPSRSGNELTDGTGLGIVLRDIGVRREAANDRAGCQPAMIAAE